MSDLTKSLHTSRITEIGIVEAIRFELETVRKNGLLNVDFAASGMAYLLDEQKTIFIFRIFQELLNNILKHARATSVSVSIEYREDDLFMLKLQDDGIGFDVSKTDTEISSSSGLGLKNLKNRAKLIGAELSIISEKGKGTITILTMPHNPAKRLIDYEANK